MFICCAKAHTGEPVVYAGTCRPSLIKIFKRLLLCSHEQILYMFHIIAFISSGNND